MQKLTEIKGKTPKEWAAEDLPYGAFAAMVREIDPVYGIYAEAGAQRKPYVIEFDEPWENEEILAYHDEHARLVARHDFDAARGVRSADGRRVGGIIRTRQP